MHFPTIFAAVTAIFAVGGLAAPAPAVTSSAVISSTTSKASTSTKATSTKSSSTKSVGRPTARPSRPACMSDEDATIVADNFRQLIQGYTIEMALAALTEDFVDYSSAVSIIINKGASEPKDVTVPIFTNRTQFMEGHGKQKPIPFETLNVWHNCNGTVSMRWITRRSGFGQPTESAAIPVIGNAVLETEPAEEGNPYNYRIHTLYSEFNTAAWLVNNGVFKPAGPVTPVPASKRSEGHEERSDVHEARDTIAHWYDVGLI